MSVLNKPFESKYGFKSNGFTVDESGNLSVTGNITATTITLIDSGDLATPSDYVVSSVNGTDYVGILSSIELKRNSTYIFELNLPTDLRFAIVDTNQTTLYSLGVKHSDGSFGLSAQNKTTGRLFFTVPPTAPDTLYYGDTVRGLTGGTLNITDPEGSFSTLTVSQSASFEDDLDIVGSLTVGELTGTSVTINPTVEILLTVNGDTIGTVNSSGLDLTNIVVESGTITDAPTQDTHIANKKYVDTRATAFSIALGS